MISVYSVLVCSLCQSDSTFTCQYLVTTRAIALISSTPGRFRLVPAHMTSQKSGQHATMMQAVSEPTRALVTLESFATNT